MVPLLSGPVFFYFHASCPLSHFHPSPFVVNDVEFPHMENYLMFSKAILFKDFDSAKRIMGEADPLLCKRYGRNVKHYEDALWVKHREDIALRGNIHKYQQNEGPRKFLMGTEHRMLVEAAPHDKIWGIGFNSVVAPDTPRSRWGLNLHGKVQMRAREFIRSGWLPPGFKL